MHSRFFPIVLSGCAVFVLALGASAAAQANPDIFVTPVPNAPFSGTVRIERTIVQPNGVFASFKTIRAIGRDNQGRIHNEARVLVPVTGSNSPQVMRIHLYDPQTRTTAYLYPQQRTYSTATVNHPPATEPPDMYASPTGSSVPVSQFAKEEDLGNRIMDGVPVHGVREVQTIPSADGTAGKEIIVTDEYWYSEDLHMNLVRKHDDPRTGSVTLTVTQISRSEPEPSFFEIPAGYKPAGQGQGAQ
jgi:hypothetical protein